MRHLIWICLLFLISTIPVIVQEQRPEISTFMVNEQYVIHERLADGSQRINVSWAVSNRPQSADLVFEQILPGFKIMNIELPRDNTWVNSSGVGIVAPLDPGPNTEGIVLLMRVVDRGSRRLLDFQLRVLPIVAERDTITHTPTAAPLVIATQPVPLSSSTPQPISQPTVASLPVTILDFHIYNEFPSINDEVLLVWDTRNADAIWIGDRAYNASAWPDGASVSGSYTGGVRLPVNQLVSGVGSQTVTIVAQNTQTRATTATSFTLQVHDGELPSQPLAEIISFTISPQSVTLSGTVTLTWETRNADALSVSSWLVENPNGTIKTVVLNPSPSGSITISVRDLVDQPGSYWIGLDAQSNQPGWAGSGYSQSIYVMP